MKVIEKVYTFIIGMIAFIGMLLLSHPRGLYIISSVSLKRILPAKFGSWIFPASLALVAGYILSFGYVKDADHIVQLIYIAFSGVAAIVGLVATIQDGVRSVIRFFKPQAADDDSSEII